jgi:arylsulfatase
MERRGEIDRQPAHLIDLSAMLIELGRGAYPKRWNDKPILPLPGTSLTPVIDGRQLPSRPIFFEHEGNRALRLGKWKIVWTNYEKKWELYNIDADRSELNDLAGGFPDRVKAMNALWHKWAAQNFVQTARVPQPATGMPKIYYFPTK